jgi:hypothetical protein
MDCSCWPSGVAAGALEQWAREYRVWARPPVPPRVVPPCGAPIWRTVDGCRGLELLVAIGPGWVADPSCRRGLRRVGEPAAPCNCAVPAARSAHQPLAAMRRIGGPSRPSGSRQMSAPFSKTVGVRRSRCRRSLERSSRSWRSPRRTRILRRARWRRGRRVHTRMWAGCRAPWPLRS